jgi:hypothetical protein
VFISTEQPGFLGWGADTPERRDPRYRESRRIDRFSYRQPHGRWRGRAGATATHTGYTTFSYNSNDEFMDIEVVTRAGGGEAIRTAR